MIEQQEDDEYLTIKVAKSKLIDSDVNSIFKSEINLSENGDGEQDLKASNKTIDKSEFSDLTISTSQKKLSINRQIDSESRSEIINQLKNSYKANRKRKPESDSCCKCLII
ncbi:hypothetical protein SteCoe_32992 [Stentor coeruleus]|uniref:Uncharacterized protein n=1 Tax=Stentor coeruleus TaxID=5963 RepID=A0A1R2AXU5_9CILI|nr:hypothetical protein SteCoe_32992 [Stentor coeruleus]